MRRGSAAHAGGFTYFGLLLAIASASGVLAGGAHLLANDLRREKELDLLLAGDEIRRAIEAYHARNGAGVNPYPKSLEALLRDPHQPGLVRYLRQVRRDPMREPGAEPPPTETGGWVLIRDVQGQVIGVHSPSTQLPLKRRGFPGYYEAFSQARSYADWKFIAAGALQAPVNAPASTNFIPSPLSPAAPLVPAGRGVPSAAPQAARGGAAPAVPGEAAATRMLELRAAPAPPPETPASPARPAPLSVEGPPPDVTAPAIRIPVPPQPAPGAGAPVAAAVSPPAAATDRVPVSAPVAPGAATSAPGAASAVPPAAPVPAGAPGATSVPPPASGTPPAPAVPPSPQGDGPQTFQIRTF